MRILWFTNVPMPEMSRLLGKPVEVVGGWMATLLDELRGCPEVTLAVATTVPGQRRTTRHSVDGVTYYGLPAPGADVRRTTAQYVGACDAVKKDFGAEIIHVHGTEKPYGLYTAIAKRTTPAVVSIQGLVHVCSRHVGGGLSLTDVSEAGIPGYLSWLRSRLQRMEWNRRGEVERRVLAGNHYFIGRTEWDKAHVLANNPQARYFHCGELLRPAFHERSWDARRLKDNVVFCSAAHSPMKGFHLVLDAMTLLRGEFPNLTVRVAGAPWNADRGFGYYGRYLKALIERRGLSGRVVPLPALPAERVAEELSQASVFAIPSLIENSPNSLGEAMLVGTPCVAALAGGITSMIDDGRTALGFQVGDAAQLAHCLRLIFTDEALGVRLSSAARAEAARRYDATKVVEAQLEVYRQVIREARHCAAGRVCSAPASDGSLTSGVQ